jgi:hypothetical protein
VLVRLRFCCGLDGESGGDGLDDEALLALGCSREADAERSGEDDGDRVPGWSAGKLSADCSLPME